MARHKKKQRSASRQDEAAARRNFLDALEAQRSNARSKVSETCDENVKATPPGVPLPGFYYDEDKCRYFRSSFESERHRRHQLEQQEQERQRVVKEWDIHGQLQHRPRNGVVTRHKNWVTSLSQRQRDFTWSACSRDQRDLMPRFLSKLLSSQVVEFQDVEWTGRLTALALHSRDTDLGAVGASSGMVEILGMRKVPPEDGQATPSRLTHPVYDFAVDGVVTSLQWRPVQELALLACHLGSGQSSSSQTSSGNVWFLPMHGHDRSEATPSSIAPTKRMKFVDPWTAQWNPTEPSKFSVGCGESSGAAYVDIVANTDDFQRAPTGALTSDVHAQSLFSTGHVVLNGTKSGGWWGWDIRAPRRIFEQEAETCAGQPAGSILDIHVLSDCRRAVVQRSNGELRVMDLRTFRPVLEFVQGATKRYLPSLRCAVDSSESIVVSAGDAKHPQAVNCFDLYSGRRVGSVEAQHAQQLEHSSAPVQQVQLKSDQHGSRCADKYHVWAISRNALYVSSRRTTNQTM
uniref:Uncharacterized protein n=1 Tax=Peronospora matthiolae TaxID=2874970 RepID=A0AAV1UQX2_9STRA